MLTDDLLDAVFAAIDSKLAATDPVNMEDLELVHRLLQARSALETAASGTVAAR